MFHQLGQLVLRNAGFRFLIPELDFDENRKVAGCVLIQLYRQFNTIDRLNAVEGLHHFLCFIRLKMTDEMPSQRQISKRVLLGQRFLQTILANLVYTGFNGFAYALWSDESS